MLGNTVEQQLETCQIESLNKTKYIAILLDNMQELAATYATLQRDYDELRDELDIAENRLAHYEE